MTSIFNDSDDSDHERKTNLRQNLEDIRKSDNDSKKRSEKAVSIRKESDNSSSGIDFISEEKELLQLRENAVYQKYAASVKRKGYPINLSPDHTRSPEKRHDSPSTYASKAQETCASSSPERDGCFIPTGSHPDHDTTILSTDLHKDTKAVPVSTTRPKSMVKASRGRRIDPKIVDDSSSNSDFGSDNDEEDAPIGPMLPQETASRTMASVTVDNLPIHQQATLGGQHGSYVSCVTIEPSGNRVVSGSLDGTAKLWDLNAMDRSLLSFRTVTPIDESGLRVARFSMTGSRLLFAGGAPVAILTNRDGATLAQTMRGDMYIMDAARTKGHTAALHVALWGPSTGETVITASADATVRLWDVSRLSRSPATRTPVVTQTAVIKLRTERGVKTVASAADWTSDVNVAAFACTDGVLRLIDVRTPTTRPAMSAPFFPNGVTEPSGLACAPEASGGSYIAIRASDSLHVMDKRALGRVVRSFNDLPNTMSETGVTFVGNDGAFLATGTSVRKRTDAEGGSLHLFSMQSLQHAWEGTAARGSGSIISVMWHARLNQIVYGTANGKLHVLYHPTLSQRGILNCLSKSESRRKYGIASVGIGEPLPGSSVRFHHGRVLATDQVSSGVGLTSKRIKRDTSNAYKPKRPSSPGPGHSTTIAKHLDAKNVSTEWSHDPRDALLKYAEKAEQNPLFTKAYEKTQPNILLADKTAEQEEAETRKAIYDRDRLSTLKDKARKR